MIERPKKRDIKNARKRDQRNRQKKATKTMTKKRHEEKGDQSSGKKCQKTDENNEGKKWRK